MWFLSVVLSLSPAHATTWAGGDYGGADILTVDGDVLNGTFTNVGAFQVPAGAVVTVEDGVPLVVEASSVLIAGTLMGDSAGSDGGDSGPSDDGSGPGGGQGNNSTISGGGGGGYGGRGGNGDGATCSLFEPGYAGGSAYGAHDGFDAPLGSGGGYLWGTGGDGGGSITLRADTIELPPSGVVSVAGERGSDHTPVGYFEGGGAAGGGSGGSIVLDATSSVLDGSLIATGGRGGDGAAGYCQEGGGGGGGGGGRIKVYGAVTGTIYALAVRGGGGGDTDGAPDTGRRGTPGTLYVDDWVAGPPVAAASGACGAATVTVSGGTPLGQAEFLVGAAAGADVLATGVCAGIVTGLSGVSSQRIRQLDAAGAITLTGAGPGCGTQVQVVDLWSCTTSAVVTLP